MKKINLKLLGALSIASALSGLINFVSIASADMEESMMNRMMDWMYGGFNMGVFAWITWILFIISLVLLIIWLTKQINKK